jgi:hypothetical protein
MAEIEYENEADWGTIASEGEREPTMAGISSSSEIEESFKFVEAQEAHAPGSKRRLTLFKVY